MNIQIHHRPAESSMSCLLKTGGVFTVYLNGALVPTLTLSDEEVIQIVQLHLAQAHAVITLAQKVGDRMRDLYPQRRLLGQHKALRGRQGHSEGSPQA
jgi:hypothetical protein